MGSALQAAAQPFFRRGAMAQQKGRTHHKKRGAAFLVGGPDIQANTMICRPMLDFPLP
jgi:hypothetical protein